jgi:hypothetical protein
MLKPECNYDDKCKSCNYYHFPPSTTTSLWDKFAKDHGFIYSQRVGLVSSVQVLCLENLISTIYDEDTDDYVREFIL